MNTETEMTKMTARIWEPIWDRFQERTKATFIKRDAFASRLIEMEVPEIRKEYANMKLLSGGKKQISMNLKKASPRNVPGNLYLCNKVDQEFTDVIKSHNLVRDAILNRMLFWSICSPGILERLNIPGFVDRRSAFRDAPGRPVSPVAVMENILEDPRNLARWSLENSNL